MSPTREGSLRLGRFAGIDVFVHWSWFLVAVYAVQYRAGHYHAFIWNVYEYLALFAIVLMHEFGHSLACKQVGGIAREIVLWPLGGVAYVSPPPRPAAHLWSLAAGPLVNAVLVPVFYFLEKWGRSSGLRFDAPDLFMLIQWVGYINLALLVFNMLPVFPLDGGQILRSLLWFAIGPAKSLYVASLIGFLGVAVFAWIAFQQESVFLGVLTFFVFLRCKSGWDHAKALMKVAAIPTRPEFACPVCKEPPPKGPIWLCPQCGTPFDMFATDAVCPNCSATSPATLCPRCGQARPVSEWTRGTRV